MEQIGHARIAMWEGGSLWAVDATPSADRTRTAPHAHHAIQVTIAMGGHFRLVAGDQDMAGDAVAVAADAVHAFEAKGLVALLFIEPESRDGRTIARRLFNGTGLAGVPTTMLGDFAGQVAAHFRAPAPDATGLATLGRALIGRMTGGVTGDAPDLRVRKMIAAAASKIDGPVSLADVVTAGGLSASRLRHLFVEQTGLPFRTYLLWLRLMRGVEAMVAGATLTQAAHDAGFADSAHFSRTFKRMFGVVPVNLRLF